MQTKHLIALSALAFATSAAMAAPLTRADLEQSVVAARASHQLRPAGDAADYTAPLQATSSTTRAQVESEVSVARAAGQLQPAGEAGDEPYAWIATDTGTRVSRASVKAETLRARANGELVPAGEGVEDSFFARAATPATPNRLARALHLQSGGQ
ncbi:hypothetical protein BH11PSE8_BH11PSE8_10410 [soil metagenome]